MVVILKYDMFKVTEYFMEASAIWRYFQIIGYYVLFTIVFGWSFHSCFIPHIKSQSLVLRRLPSDAALLQVPYFHGRPTFVTSLDNTAPLYMILLIQTRHTFKQTIIMADKLRVTSKKVAYVALSHVIHIHANID